MEKLWSPGPDYGLEYCRSWPLFLSSVWTDGCSLFAHLHTTPLMARMPQSWHQHSVRAKGGAADVTVCGRSHLKKLTTVWQLTVFWWLWPDFFFNGYFVLQSCDLNGDVESQSFEEEFVGGASRSRVRLMANQLQAKLDESSSTCRTSSSPASADFCRQVRACWFLINHIDFWWSNRGCGHDVCTIHVSLNANTPC